MTVLLGTAAVYVYLGFQNQWDFETYYYAAASYRAGLDPYSLESLSSVTCSPLCLHLEMPISASWVEG